MILNLVFSSFLSLHLIDQVFGSSHEMDHSKIISIKVIAKWCNTPRWRGQCNFLGICSATKLNNILLRAPVTAVPPHLHTALSLGLQPLGAILTFKCAKSKLMLMENNNNCQSSSFNFI